MPVPGAYDEAYTESLEDLHEYYRNNLGASFTQPADAAPLPMGAEHYTAMIPIDAATNMPAEKIAAGTITDGDEAAAATAAIATSYPDAREIVVESVGDGAELGGAASAPKDSKSAKKRKKKKAKEAAAAAAAAATAAAVESSKQSDTARSMADPKGIAAPSSRNRNGSAAAGAADAPKTTISAKPSAAKRSVAAGKKGVAPPPGFGGAAYHAVGNRGVRTAVSDAKVLPTPLQPAAGKVLSKKAQKRAAAGNAALAATLAAMRGSMVDGGSTANSSSSSRSSSTATGSSLRYTANDLLALRNSPLSKEAPRDLKFGPSVPNARNVKSQKQGGQGGSGGPGQDMTSFQMLQRALVHVAKQAKESKRPIPGELAVLAVIAQALQKGDPVDITIGVSSATGTGKASFKGKWAAVSQYA